MKKRFGAVLLAAGLMVGVAAAGVLQADQRPASHAGSTAKATATAYVTGTPVTGSASVSVTTASLSAHQAPTASHVRVQALKHYQPNSWTTPSTRHSETTVAGPPPTKATAQTAEPNVLAQTVGANFLGAQFVDDSNAVPPDSMGAAGPTQFLVGVNGRVRTFAKSTTSADGVLNMSLDSFFNALGGTTNGTSDPRVRYDRMTGRWFVSAIDTPAGSNHILLAVSNTGVITNSTVWHYFSIPADANTFNDFDTLGVDEDALYIGANVFDATSGDFVNTTAYVVRKTSVLGTGPIVYTKFGNLVDMVNTGVGPYAPMGVDNFDTNTNTGYIVGIDASFSGQLDVRRISNPGGTPSISSTIEIPTLDTNIPAPVPQPGTGPTLDAGELPVLSNAVIRNGRLWTSHNIEVDTTGAATDGGGRDGVRWYELQGLGGTPSVKQTGTIFDSGTVNPMNYWMPSVMVSGQGNTAFGFSRAGTDPVQGFASAATTGRLPSDTAGTVGLPSVFGLSAFNYNPAGDTATPKRWGDFSNTSLDPTDDMTMWTIQEYTSAGDKWGVRIAKLVAPAPTVTTVDQVAAGATGTTIAVNGTGFYQSPGGITNHFTAAISGGVVVNSVASVTPTKVVLNVTTVGVSPGPQTVTVTNPDGQTATGPVVVGAAAAACPSCTDFNGDSKPDILWHNPTTGAIVTWLMNNLAFGSSTSFAGKTSVSPVWKPVATADFNADGHPDILWHNTVTGQIVTWLMNGTTYISGNTFGGKSGVSTTWTPVATADFNADGKPDILWHNRYTGQLVAWLMNGMNYGSASAIGSPVSTAWTPFAANDLNADTKPDILWHNAVTGQVVSWLLNGLSFSSSTPIGSPVSTVWEPVSTNDYNADTKPDILWHNNVTGALVVWLMNGTTFSSSTSFSGKSSVVTTWVPIV